MKTKITFLLFTYFFVSILDAQKIATWIADNGNGTYTNPLFQDEFSDPDLIRVGDDYYLTGTTMHAMPGLPILHSKDLVNWEFLTYAVDKINFGPAFELKDGKDIYGQGIWAPCLRYHKGTFYLYTNINGQKTQLFTATNPKGPWKQTQMKGSYHDLSVLFDEDNTAYIIWGYDEIKIAELSTNFDDIKPGTEKILIQKSSGAGEGCHFYKINGKYYITSTNYDPLCYQVCLRSDKPTGPYEVNVMSAEENLGIGTGWRLSDTRSGPPYKLIAPTENFVGCIPMHQGGIVQTQSGEWWGWSMLDYNSVGRVTALSPVTWKDGWPYFGLPGNLGRSPRTWIKPNTGFHVQPHETFQRSDDFSTSTLQPIWQWNHVPDDTKWSLNNGVLRLNSLPASNFFHARNTLTQRAIGPISIATTEMNFSALQSGDIAGLGLLNVPYAWIGVAKKENSFILEQFNEQTGKLITQNLPNEHVWLRVTGNFDTDSAQFSYSTDSVHYTLIGDTVIMPYQLRTFQGIRYSLFNFNDNNKEGGYAAFNNFMVQEPQHLGLTKPIPYNKIIKLTSLGDSSILVNWKKFIRPVEANSFFTKDAAAYFKVLDRGNGRIALQSILDGGFITVKGQGGMAEIRIEEKEQGEASLFQWQDMLRGDLMLMSIVTHKYLFVDPHAKSLTSADALGTRPDRKDGSCFIWEEVKQ